MSTGTITQQALLLLGERVDSVVGLATLGNIFTNVKQRMLRSAVWTFATKRDQLYVDIDPVADAEWDILTVYAVGDVATLGGIVYFSRVAANVGNSPEVSATEWQAITQGGAGANTIRALNYDSGTTYESGEVVLADKNVYVSLVDNNVGNPVADTDFWADTGLDEIVPLFGFQHQYTIPSDFIRLAPATFADWSCFQEIQREAGTKFLSQMDQPLNIRYVYDHNLADGSTDVLFEGALSAMLASMSCERITQSNTKKADADAKHKEYMLEAKRTNAIERGPFIPIVDDWVAVRQDWGSNSAASDRLWPRW